MLIKDTLKKYIKLNNDLNTSMLGNLYSERDYLIMLSTRDIRKNESLPLFNQYKKYSLNRLKVLRFQLKRRYTLEQNIYKKYDS